MSDKKVNDMKNLQYLFLLLIQVHLTIVLDNVGFEFFSDLVLLGVLLSSASVESVTMHVKPMPWMISDVTRDDVRWTLKQLLASENPLIQLIGRTLQTFMNLDQLRIRTHDFWSLPYNYNIMKKLAPDLYEELSMADLIIFKGQVNFIKLIGGYKWNITTPFHQALEGFNPAPLCALVVMKYPVLVGVDPSSDRLEEIKQTLSNFHRSSNTAIVCDSNVAPSDWYFPHMLRWTASSSRQAKMFCPIDAKIILINVE